MNSPIICFGQQPCGIFPKRFLVAKIDTARRLQQEIGGEIIFFYHDSDHDPRETRTIFRHRQTGEAAQINFTFENRWQRKFSPLSHKRVPKGWQEKTALQLPNYTERAQVLLFEGTTGATVADFCLNVYERMGLLDGIKVLRSSDKQFRAAACDIDEMFVDIEHEGEIVRARLSDDKLRLHEGGDLYIDLPLQAFTKEQISPTRDSRLRWMQSVIHCTHYVSGAGEQNYLNMADAPEIKFVTRDIVDRPEESFIDLPESIATQLPNKLATNKHQ